VRRVKNLFPGRINFSNIVFSYNLNELYSKNTRKNATQEKLRLASVIVLKMKDINHLCIRLTQNETEQIINHTMEKHCQKILAQKIMFVQ